MKDLTFKIWHRWADEPDKNYTTEEFLKEIRREARKLKKLEKEARS